MLRCARVVLPLFVMLVTVVAFADDVVPPAGPLPVRFHVTGTASPSGRFTELSLEVTSGERIRAIRFHGAPSNRLIAAFVDNTAGDPEGTSWYAAYGFERGNRIAQGPLAAGTRIAMTSARPDAADTKLVVRIDAIWPGEAAYRERTFDVTVNPNNFGFTVETNGVVESVCCDGCCSK